jgi:hypothetical protein
MTVSEVERWALEVLDRLTRLGSREDDIVEFKRVAPDPQKFARILAGHANAARGERILWILGADEDAGFVGVEGLEWSALWPQVERHFEGAGVLDPVITGIEWQGKGGYAVAFETTSPPYVVKNPDYGKKAGESCAYEVPWRVGTATRTATRTHLLLLSNYLNRKWRQWLKVSDAPFVDNSNGPNRIYQVSVANVSPSHIRGCKAILHRIERGAETVWGGQDALLTFQPSDRSDATNKTIWRGRPQLLDVLAFQLEPIAPTPFREEPTTPWPDASWDHRFSIARLVPATEGWRWIFEQRLEDIFSVKTDYFLTIDFGASDEDAPAYEVKLQFRLAGKNSELKVVSQIELM